MAYSTIRVKTGGCSFEGCSYRGPLTKGMCGNHYWAAIRLKSAQKFAAKDANEPKEHNAELERWFKERRAEMVGFCSNCGNPSSKKNDQFFKCSIAHILPKAYFPSVSTHEYNWIELCFWGDNSCHTNMDNKILDLTEMACWNEIVEKFLIMYPSIDKKERRRIPATLMQYVNIDI